MGNVTTDYVTDVNYDKKAIIIFFVHASPIKCWTFSSGWLTTLKTQGCRSCEHLRYDWAHSQSTHTQITGVFLTEVGVLALFSHSSQLLAISDWGQRAQSELDGLISSKDVTEASVTLEWHNKAPQINTLWLMIFRTVTWLFSSGFQLVLLLWFSFRGPLKGHLPEGAGAAFRWVEMYQLNAITDIKSNINQQLRCWLFSRLIN